MKNTEIGDPQCDIEKLFKDFNFWYVWSYINSEFFEQKHVVYWLSGNDGEVPRFVPEAQKMIDVWIACGFIREIELEYISKYKKYTWIN